MNLVKQSNLITPHNVLLVDQKNTKSKLLWFDYAPVFTPKNQTSCQTFLLIIIPAFVILFFLLAP